MISATSESAVAHSRELIENPMIDHRMTARCPHRAVIQPVTGVNTAVAITFSVTTQETCSGVADNAPCNCGTTTLTMVVVSAYSIVHRDTASRISPGGVVVDRVSAMNT